MSRLQLIPDLLNQLADKEGGKVVFSGPGWSITYQELEKRTRRLANQLAALPTRSVAIVLNRGLQAIESTLAITRADAVCVPLDPRSHPSELARVLQHSGADAIITDVGHLAKVRAAAQEGSLIILDGESRDVIDSRFRFARYQDWVLNEERLISPNSIDVLDQDKEAFLNYTSGTTSAPKGVLMHQKSYLISAKGVCSTLDLTSEDVVFWPLPVFHCFGIVTCIFAILTAGASAYLPGVDQDMFDGLRESEALKKSPTIIVGTPATFQNLLDDIKLWGPKLSLSLSNLRACMYGGSQATSSLGIQIRNLLGVPLLSNYGCAEGLVIAITKPNPLAPPKTSMTPMPYLEMKLVDSNGHEVSNGEQGELLIKGPSLMLGYLKEEQSPFVLNGWWATGDVAKLSNSADGPKLTLVGRKKEIIIRSGENIYPTELESVLMQHPGVSDVVVSGIQHRIFGEVPVAFIAKKETELDPITLMDACRASLPDHKVPTAFFEIDEVPRTFLGKPRRIDMTPYTKTPITIPPKRLSRSLIERMVVTETVSACGIEAGIKDDESRREWLSQHFCQPFSDLGMNSMAGVVLRDRLANLIGLSTLTNTLVFDYPTPAAVSQYLCNLLLQNESPWIPTTVNENNEKGIEPIAIISMACRYPGGISSPEDMWKLLSEEVDATTDFPTDRGWNVEDIYHPNPDMPRKSTTKRGGFLPRFDYFDATLFGMAPKEALATDPQQRILLETAWELFERGRISPSSVEGSATAAFVGTMYEEYAQNGTGNDELEPYLAIGSSGGVMSGRLSYHFKLHGPSLAVSTGCSSSLAAMHLGAQALRNGECTMAIAGGVTTMATPQPFIALSRRRALSYDGRCRAYSSDASGTGWSEGVGLVLLERLWDAKRNGHQVLALIRGSAVNSDGKSNGLTAPNGLAQEMCIQTALKQADLKPTDVDVLEGHGSATPLGDSIEIQAVMAAYGNRYASTVKRSTPLLLGSIKSNIGHTQAAAGIAGVIKMVESIRRGIAPKSLHIREPLQIMSWEGSGVEVLSEARPWPSSGRPRRAAVSSFGIGGTNSHLILEQADVAEENVDSRRHVAAPFPWLLSGATEAAVRAQALSLLKAWKNKDSKTSISIRHQHPVDVALSLATTRSALRYRASLTYASCEDMYDQIQTVLEHLSQGRTHPDLHTGHVQSPRLTFLFSGQGGQLPSLRTLNDLSVTFPVFSEALGEVLKEVDQHLECPLMVALENDTLRDRVDFAQVSLFVFQVAMYHLLDSLNIRPQVVTGHSVGEIAAAYASGALSLRTAAIIITTRAKLIAGLPTNGAMVSISATEEEVLKELVRTGATAVIGVVNSATSVVVSGTLEAVETVAETFGRLGRRTTILRNVKHGYHSPMMYDILSDLQNALDTIFEHAGVATIPFVSTITGKRVDAEELNSSNYWIRNVRDQVRLVDTIHELQRQEGVSAFVEVGPSSILSPHIPDAVGTYDTVGQLLHTIGRLWTRGVPINWQNVFAGSGARLVHLPVYPFQSESEKFWLPYIPLVPAQSTKSIASKSKKQHVAKSETFFSSTSIPGTKNILCCSYVSKARQRWLRDHVIGGKIVFPAAGFIDLVMKAAHECSEYSTQDCLTLDEMTVVTPMILPFSEEDEHLDSTVLEIQIIVRDPQRMAQGNSICRKFDVYSRVDGVATEHEWTCHATGILQFTSLRSTKREPFYPGTDPTHTQSDVDIPEAYAALAGLGIEYGPSFQGVRGIWHLQNDKNLLVKIEPPTNTDDRFAFTLHPAVLDSALHAFALASSKKFTESDIPLPFSLRGIHIFEPLVAHKTIFVHVRWDDENRLSLTMAHELTGNVIVKILDICLRSWEAQAPLKKGCLYFLHWIELPPKHLVDAADTTTTDRIVRTKYADMSNSTAVIQRVHEAIAETLHIVNDWRAEKAYATDGSRLVFVTEKATSADDRDINVVASAVWGFTRSVQAELGQHRVALVDLDGTPESEDSLSLALASKNDVVTIHRGILKIPTLVRRTRDVQVNRPLELDISGTVLITGGTGGLGATIALDLVHTHGVGDILLVSRSGMQAKGAQKLCDELRMANAHVHVEACEVGDRAQLASLLEKHQQRRPITAVIHCAGVNDDAVLDAQTVDRVSNVLRPKVDGAWNLNECSPDTVRTFVLFSSFVSVLGNEGQTAYTAANAFLDALARLRVARGLPALSLAWGPWANADGMAAEGKLPVVSSRLDFATPLTDKQGMNLFYKALAFQVENPSEPVLFPLLSSNLSPPLLSTNSPSITHDLNTPDQSHSHLLWQKLLVNISSENRFDSLLSLVKDQIAAVLGYQSGFALPNHPLHELGFDSSTSVTFTQKLRSLTGLYDLPGTLAVDFYTPESLVHYLLPLIEERMRIDVDSSSDAFSDAIQTPSSSDHEKEGSLDPPGMDIAPSDSKGKTDISPNEFQGLATLYRRLIQSGKYTGAAILIAMASLAMPQFSEDDPGFTTYAANPICLPARPTGRPDTEISCPLVFIAPFLPKFTDKGAKFSVYSKLATAMKGGRDVYELPHPTGEVVPKDFNALISLHAHTIRKNFRNRRRIIIAGYSVGGVIAHAVASRLAQTEDEWLGGVVLIDTYLGMSGKDDPDWLNALPGEAFGAQFPGSNARGPKSQVTQDQQARNLDHVLAKMGAYFRTLQDWDVIQFPLPEHVPAIFIRARDPSDNMPKDASVWRAQWPRANRTVNVPGNHLTMLNETNAQNVAIEFERWVEEQAQACHKPRSQEV